MLKHETDFSAYLGKIAPRGRTMLLPALLEAQKCFGYISKDSALEIGAALRIPLAEITGVIEFYTMLSLEPRGDPVIRVCTSPVCSARGGHQLHREMSAHLPAGASIEKVECLGLCDQAPAAMVSETPVGRATPERILNPEGS
ncbi:MAG TPA: hypothetical protein DEH25_07750, partial [Chloroflexi bacterium]|nr:hypothetical protein [Chloroflexota bacterium]